MSEILPTINIEEEKAFSRNLDKLYRQNRRSLLRAIQQNLPTDLIEEADDVLHQLIIKFMRDRSRSKIVEIKDDDEKRRYFMVVILKNIRREILDLIKRKNAQKRGGGVSEIDLEDISEDIPDREFSQFEWTDLKLLLEAKLTFQDQRIFELRFIQHYKIEEIVELLGISKATIKRHLQNIRERLGSLDL